MKILNQRPIYEQDLVVGASSELSIIERQTNRGSEKKSKKKRELKRERKYEKEFQGVGTKRLRVEKYRDSSSSKKEDER